jgi:glycosyltransferase involved in cell wall biosynthesis
MKILLALTYYRPHVSGLTIYVERLARALADAGHQATVMTSRYDARLPRREVLDGVRIERVPVLMRVSKGVLMPTLGWESTRLALAHDVISLHLPQFDAAGIALRGRLLGRPTVLTYHCDIRLPQGGMNFIANRAVDLANRLAGSLSDRVIAYTEDYARHSPYLSRYLHKLVVIPPPVGVAPTSAESIQSMRRRHAKRQGPIIGMAARLATEKGVEFLLQALPYVLQRYPEAEVWFAGQYQDVLGEAEYARRLGPLLEENRDRWTFLGILDPSEMAAFFSACDVTVLPSVNSTESFGLVQIESMICGTPVVASDLPGVRQPVLSTGMGQVVAAGQAEALAKGLIDVLDGQGSYAGRNTWLAGQFAPTEVARRYLELFRQLGARERGAIS